MQIQTSGRPIIEPRKTFEEITNIKNPHDPRRVKIVAPTAVRGIPVYPGTVLQFDIAGEGREDWAALINCLKAVRVKLDTPLHIAPEPPPLPAPSAEPSVTSQLAAELLRQIAAASNASQKKTQVS